MGAVFLDYILCNGLEGRSPAQLADGLHEVRVEGQSQTTAATKTVSFLCCQAVDLPSTKLPANTTHVNTCQWKLQNAVAQDLALIQKVVVYRTEKSS